MKAMSLRVLALLLASPATQGCNYEAAAQNMFGSSCEALVASSQAGFCTSGHPQSSFVGYICGTSCGTEATYRATYPNAYTGLDIDPLFQTVNQAGLFTPTAGYAFYGNYGDDDPNIPGKQIYYQCSQLADVAAFWQAPLSALCTPTISAVCPESYDTVCAAFGPKATASRCVAPVSARKDPHFKLPHGGRTDIRGESGGIYNVLSAKNVTFNVEFGADDFKWSKRLVHGTNIGSAYWMVRTKSNQAVAISYAAQSITKGRHFVVKVDDGAENQVTEAQGPFYLSNLKVALKGRQLTVETIGRWRMTAAMNTFPFASLNKGKLLLDVELYPLYDADKDKVAPHGIFGQAYDDDELAVDGAVDKPAGDEYTTKAQGEGAIEGVLADYRMASSFATAFKYSRFDAMSAPHRNVSALTGLKRHVGRTVRSVGGADHTIEDPQA